MRFLVIGISLLVAILHFTIPTRTTLSWPGSYEAFTHLWVGVLMLRSCQTFRKDWPHVRIQEPSLLCLFGLTLFEAVVFFYARSRS